MKMTQAHYTQLSAKLDATLEVARMTFKAYRTQYISAGLSDVRMIWDLVRHAGIHITESRNVHDEGRDLPLYDYLDDSHIQTALNAYIKERIAT